MAVIESDVVQISWEIEDSPVLELIEMMKEFKKEATGATDEASDGLTELSKTANEVSKDVIKLSDGLEDIGGTKLGSVTGGMDKGIVKTAKETTGLFGELRKLAELKMNKLSTAFNSVSGNILRFKKNVSTGFQQAKTSVSDFFQCLSESKSEAEDIGSAFDGLKGKITGALGVAGITTGLGAIAGTINSVTSATNQFQAATGAGAEEMKLYGEDIKSLYTNGMGESLEDVANAMVTVKNNTKFAAEEIGAVTQNALLLRDTFDFDVNESVRAAQMMMDQFGVSGDEAYNLIVQGAQNGLNKNDDLLDTINEYSVHFKQLGFGAEDMFNMLTNGAANGTFSVDTLGNAMKEFGIRAIDCSDTTAEGFKLIGLNADTMALKFKQGEKTGKEAFTQTVQALKNMKDPIAQNTAGVNLFGTMWEDLGAEGVFSLANLNGEIDISKDKLTEINNVRYDDAGSALISLGRTINVELGESVGNAVNKAKGYIQNFIVGLQGADNGSFFSGLGESVRSVGNALKFVIDNLNIFGPLIGTVVAAFVIYKSVMTGINIVAGIYNGLVAVSTAASAIKAGGTLAEAAATTTATGAQVGLNAALLACPITWIIILIVALIAIIVLLIANWDKVKEVAGKVWDFIVEKWGQLCNWFSQNVITPIKNFFTSLFNSIISTAGTVKDAIVNAFSTAANKIKEVWNGIVDFFKGIWDKIKGWVDKITNAGKSALGVETGATTEHAWGGLMTTRHVGVVAEAGPEMIIPLSNDKKKRAFNLWQQTGQMLGVTAPEENTILTEYSPDKTTETVATYKSSRISNNNYYSPNISITINGTDDRNGSVRRQVKQGIREGLKEIFDDLETRNQPKREV